MRKWDRGDDEIGDRTHLLQQSGTLDDSLEGLSQSRAVLNETNEIGANVMSRLLSQRDSILRTRQYVEEAGNIHQNTRGLIGSIGRTDFLAKLLMYITIFFLILAIFFVVVYKIIR